MYHGVVDLWTKRECLRAWDAPLITFDDESNLLLVENPRPAVVGRNEDWKTPPRTVGMPQNTVSRDSNAYKLAMLLSPMQRSKRDTTFLGEERVDWMLEYYDENESSNDSLLSLGSQTVDLLDDLDANNEHDNDHFGCD